MGTAVLVLIPFAVVATATLSGTFGMGGGMILMGVYAAFLNVPQAMVLHGVTQLASNGSRCVLLWRHVHWRTVRVYLLGSVPAVALMASFTVVVDRTTLYLLLGAVPLSVAVLPRTERLTVDRPSLAALCGAVVTCAQLTAGVSGPLLDVFFVRSRLDRHEVIATKAVTQAWGHLLKLVYFTSLVSTPGTLDGLPGWLPPLVVACALAGTALGKGILGRLTDTGFRRLSTSLVTAIALVFLARGIGGFLTP